MELNYQKRLCQQCEQRGMALSTAQLEDLTQYLKLLVRWRPHLNLTGLRDAERMLDVLIVESEHDTVVPHQVIVNYREACISARSLTYRLIEGADHGLSNEEWKTAYTVLLVNWFNEFVFGKQPKEQAAAVSTPTSAAPEASPPEA